jgi:hypothetical protein
MSLALLRYNDSLQHDWDNFVLERAINGSILHTRKFYNHNASNKLDDHSFLIYNNGKIIALIPFTISAKDGGLVLNSHPRATYGGFVISKEVNIKEAVNLLELVIEESKSLGIKEIIIRNPFRILYNIHGDEMDYAMWFHGFTIKSRELEIAIQLDKKEILQSRYTKGAKSGVNKARKIILVEESEEYEAFWALLEKSLSEKYNAKPTHNFSDFCNLRVCLSNDKIKLFVAKFEGKIIAGVLIFVVNKVCVHAQYIAYDILYQNVRPLNILIDYISNWAYGNGYKYFNLGMANENNGRIINHGLYKFKESYGGRGILRETMNLSI